MSLQASFIDENQALYNSLFKKEDIMILSLPPIDDSKPLPSSED